MHYPTQPAQVTFCNFTLAKDVPANDIVDRHPVIDRYGQWIPAKWMGKAYSDDDLKKLWATEDLKPEKYPVLSSRRRLGIKLRATGFFRTEKIDRRWVIDRSSWTSILFRRNRYRRRSRYELRDRSNGQRISLRSVPAAGPAWLHPIKLFRFMPPTRAPLRRGWEEQGDQHAVERLRNWGFNTIGNWSNTELAARSGMPYVLPLYGWTPRKYFLILTACRTCFRTSSSECGRGGATPVQST